MKRFLIVVLGLILAVVGCIPATAQGAKAESFIEEIIDYNLKKTASASVQDWIDCYLAENADKGTEWYAIALSNYGDYDFTSYKNSLTDYLSANEVGSASSRLKFALALIATGDRSSAYIKRTLENSVGEQGIMSLVFGLHILNNSYTCEKHSVKSVTDDLISMQSADGGWSLTGRNGDVDVTAMTVQALAPQYSSNASVKSAIDKALVFLSAKQNEDGTYSSYGVSNPESIAQVIIALSSLGIDAEKDERFIKNSNNLFDALEVFRLKDGGYCHQKGSDPNETATVQVFCAAVAFENFKKGESSFYIFSQKNSVTQEKPAEENTEVSATEKTDIDETTSANKNGQTSLQTETTKTVTEQTTAQADKTEENIKPANSYKIWIIAAIVILSVCLCVGLLMKKKIRPQGCVVVFVVAVCAILLVIFTNIKPVGSDENSADKNGAAATVTISIRCDTVKDKNDDAILSTGIILDETEIQIDSDDTVYDVLSRACKENDIHLEITGTKETLYVEGISNLYEKDYGDLSGWMYFVNGKSPSIGCGKYELSHQDEIVWHYTCDLGEDLNY